VSPWLHSAKGRASQMMKMRICERSFAAAMAAVPRPHAAQRRPQPAPISSSAISTFSLLVPRWKSAVAAAARAPSLLRGLRSVDAPPVSATLRCVPHQPSCKGPAGAAASTVPSGWRPCRPDQRNGT
jgi:hypothetical protein